MSSIRLPFQDMSAFSKLFLDYIDGQASLNNFYGLPPQIDVFEEQIQRKQIDANTRKILQKVLNKQYENEQIGSELRQNLDFLTHPTTYTITTGHQLNLCTGPLYFIYKMATVIKITQELKKKYPTYHFVPIYWMASEDHDFEEINHINIKGKKYEWQNPSAGPVGELSLNDIEVFFDALPIYDEQFLKIYKQSINLAEATRKLVHHLFGAYGLVVLDANDAELKQFFAPIMEKEIKTQFTFDKVNKTNKELANFGYKIQATPREINLFYITQNRRDLIKRVNHHYVFGDSNEIYSEAELIQKLNNHPQNFSPNVLLRPLYQELLLPNLAYIGGPGELAYWLQLKDLFEAVDVAFPILIPRFFAMVVSKQNAEQLTKLNFKLEDLLKSFNEFKILYLEKNVPQKYELDTEELQLEQIYKQLELKMGEIEPTLIPYIRAELTRARKRLGHAEQKFKKALLRQEHDAIRQLEGIKNALFPDGKLQERVENIMGICDDPHLFIANIIDDLDPFQFQFNLIRKDDKARSQKEILSRKESV